MLPNEIRAKNGNYPVTRFQTTDQIAGAIVKAVSESSQAAEYLKKYFVNDNPVTSLKLIFAFTKGLIPYKKEAGNNQTAKTLPRIIQDAKSFGGDCKHYSTTIASLCKALNIPVKLRLISQQTFSRNPTHIYAVATINGRDYIIDPCMKSFNQEARYTFKKDIKL